MKGDNPFHRIRVGDYRIIYEIHGDMFSHPIEDQQIQDQKRSGGITLMKVGCKKP
jgi:hypothetical protein